MTIAKMVREMIDRGVDPDVIELAVATAEEALCPRNSAENADERRRRKDRERKQNVRTNPRNSAEFHGNAESAYKEKEDKKEVTGKQRSVRGTRIAADWSPSEGEKTFAAGEGFLELEIAREAQKFRDYWIAAAGAKGLKLDWSATWRQWIRTAADRAGKRPAQSAQAQTSDHDLEQQIVRFARGMPWSVKYFGPEPGQIGCKAPDELLAKHGLMPDGRRIQHA